MEPKAVERFRPCSGLCMVVVALHYVLRLVWIKPGKYYQRGLICYFAVRQRRFCAIERCIVQKIWWSISSRVFRSFQRRKIWLTSSYPRPTVLRPQLYGKDGKSVVSEGSTPWKWRLYNNISTTDYHRCHSACLFSAGLRSSNMYRFSPISPFLTNFTPSTLIWSTFSMIVITTSSHSDNCPRADI